MTDTWTFTLDEESEKRLYDILSDIDVTKTPAFTITDKHGHTAEYVKVIRCKDCAKRSFTKCPMAIGRQSDDDYCSRAERKEE